MIFKILAFRFLDQDFFQLQLGTWGTLVKLSSAKTGIIDTYFRRNLKIAFRNRVGIRRQNSSQ